MNIGIILYSQTGNTYSVSLKLKEKLITAGHSVNIKQLKVTSEVRLGIKILGSKRFPIPSHTMHWCLVLRCRPFPCHRQWRAI